MKRRTLAALLFLWFGTIANAQNLTCRDFQQGGFIVPSKTKQIPDHIIYRDGNTQIEVFELKGETIAIYGTVNWVKDCTYQLKFRNEVKKLPQFYRDVNQHGGIITEIIEIKGKCALYTAMLSEDGIKTTKYNGMFCKQN